MNRRHLIQSCTLGLAMSSLASLAKAGPSAASGGTGFHDMKMMGFPIIREGRLLNYVFVNLKLHLADGIRPEAVQAKEPLLRDAIVRASHATPFVLPDTDREVNVTALTAVVMRHCNSLIGQGAITRVEVLKQMSRNR